MIKVNVIYDDVYDDVDIIEVPETIFSRLDSIVREFLEWKRDAPICDEDYWTEINDRTYSVLETKGFVKWLNMIYCNEDESVAILKQHTDYCPLYECIEF